MRRQLLPLTLALSALLATVASAADWRQFRHDGYRTGRSEDKVPGPLTDIWTWEASGLYESSRPFGTVAVWKDRLFTFSNENSAPHLVCVDARTGNRRWTRALNLGRGAAVARQDAGPAVTPEGAVYAYGTQPFSSPVQHRLMRDANGGNFRGSEPGFVVDVRAYRALDGALIASQPLPSGWSRRESNPFITQIYLNDGFPPSVRFRPDERSHWRMTDPMTLGPPMLNVGEFMAMTAGDLFVRWTPLGVPDYSRLAHSGSYQFRELVPGYRFEGFPMTLSGGGVVIGDDSTKRFIGLLFPGSTVPWHWEIPWAFGIPSSQADRIFLGIGGAGARNGLICIGGGSGEPVWMFPPGGPPHDGQFEAREKFLLPTGPSGPLAPDEITGETFIHIDPPHRVALGNRVPPNTPGGGGVIPEPLNLPRGRTRDETPLSRAQRGQPRAGGAGGTSIAQRVFRSPTVGHLNNVGLVLARERVYGWIANTIVCVDQKTGQPVWIREHPVYHPIANLVATRDELIVCQATGTAPTTAPKLWGLDLDTGNLRWSITVPRFGHLAVGHGLLYLSTGDTITAYGPAERTFRMAVDSGAKESYREDVPEPEAAPEEPAQCQEPDSPLPIQPAGPRVHKMLYLEEKGEKPAPELGDATVLRLQFGQPLEVMLQAARERRRISGDLPRVLLLDWFTPDRRARIAADGHGRWSPETERAFLFACERLAAEFRPDHFELAAEINVFLAYHPLQVEDVANLLRAARAAIRRVSPETRTLISFNVEVLNGTYGRAKSFPFRDVPVQPEKAVERQLALLAEVDEAGITTHPQSGNIGPEQIPLTYLASARLRLGDRPLLVTRIAVRADVKPPTGPVNQIKFLKRVTQALYWVDATLVAYPDIAAEGEDTALKTKKEDRPALAVWRQMLSWKRVKELTAAKPVPTS